MSENKPVEGAPEEVPEIEVTMNQVVAYNVKFFRLQRGLTQEQLGLRLEALTGRPWSKATVSAAERSWDGNRIRQFDADDLLALSGALGYPVNSLFLPPEDDGSARYRFKGVAWFHDDVADLDGESDEQTAARIDPSGGPGTLTSLLFEGMQESSEPADQAYVRRVDAIFELHHPGMADHTLLTWEVGKSFTDSSDHARDIREAQELRTQASVLRRLLRNVEGAAQYLEGRTVEDGREPESRVQSAGG